MPRKAELDEQLKLDILAGLGEIKHRGYTEAQDKAITLLWPHKACRADLVARLGRSPVSVAARWRQLNARRLTLADAPLPMAPTPTLAARTVTSNRTDEVRYLADFGRELHAVQQRLEADIAQVEARTNRLQTLLAEGSALLTHLRSCLTQITQLGKQLSD